MNNQRRVSGWIIFSAIFSGIAFYGLLFVLVRCFPLWTGRKIENEWILVLISAIPLLIVLAFLLAGNVSKASIAGMEFEFDKPVSANLLEKLEVHPEVLATQKKGGIQELYKIINYDLEQITKSKILLVALDKAGKRVGFIPLRQYIHVLSRRAFLEYVVFVDESGKYLGFTTAKRFITKFPKSELEQLVEDMENDLAKRKITNVKSFPLARMLRERSTVTHVRTLIEEQWSKPYKKEKVASDDLERLGALHVHVEDKTDVKFVFWTLTKYDVPGIPVTDTNGKFLGIFTKNKITDTIISQLLDKSVKSDKKA
ncbi:MAG: CBS domain-containing protein [Anaerolineales bacterium]|nr:CBS domain-containing protein [Anaerolineales bacterium]